MRRDQAKVDAQRADAVVHLLLLIGQHCHLALASLLRFDRAMPMPAPTAEIRTIGKPSTINMATEKADTVRNPSSFQPPWCAEVTSRYRTKHKIGGNTPFKKRPERKEAAVLNVNADKSVRIKSSLI